MISVRWAVKIPQVGFKISSKLLLNESCSKNKIEFSELKNDWHLKFGRCEDVLTRLKLLMIYDENYLNNLPIIHDSLQLQVRRSPEEKTTKMAVLVSAYTLIVTIMYIVTKNFTVFEASYGILVFLMLSHDLRLNTHQKTKVGLQIFITGLFM